MVVSTVFHFYQANLLNHFTVRNPIFYFSKRNSEQNIKYIQWKKLQRTTEWNSKYFNRMKKKTLQKSMIYDHRCREKSQWCWINIDNREHKNWEIDFAFYGWQQRNRAVNFPIIFPENNDVQKANIIIKRTHTMIKVYM